MVDIFIEGGPLFMGILTIVFLLVLVQAVRVRMKFAGGGSLKDARRQLGYVRSLGVLGLVVGVLGQLIGMYQAFSVIQDMGGNVSPSMLMGGLKVSMITSIYGIVILAISLILWMTMDATLKRKEF